MPRHDQRATTSERRKERGGHARSTSRLFLGASLQSLTLRLHGRAVTASAINDAIVTISRLPVLTELYLCLPSFFPNLSFAPLAVAPRLEKFGCEAVNLGQPTHAQLDHLRQRSRAKPSRSARGEGRELELEAHAAAECACICQSTVSHVCETGEENEKYFS